MAWPGTEQHRRPRLGEPGQVEDVAVLPVLVVRVAVAQPLGRRHQQQRRVRARAARRGARAARRRRAAAMEGEATDTGATAMRDILAYDAAPTDAPRPRDRRGERPRRGADPRRPPLGLPAGRRQGPGDRRRRRRPRAGDGRGRPRQAAGRRHLGGARAAGAADARPRRRPARPLGELVDERLAAALARRLAMQLDRDAYRVVHAESDGLPGLVVDRYADAAVIQTTSVAMNAARAEIAGDCPGAARRARGGRPRRRLGARLRGSPPLRRPAPRRARRASSTGWARTTLEADLLTDGKTGGFLDQADNHAALAALAPPGARALDAFTYHGGFALALARKAGGRARCARSTRAKPPSRARPPTPAATASPT